MTDIETETRPRFCSYCGAEFHVEARFCHRCGRPVDGHERATQTAHTPQQKVARRLPWAIAGAAVVAVGLVTALRTGARSPEAGPAATPLGAGVIKAPDISAMSPQERADRLFDRVMTLWSQGKRDSVAFFAPMALGAFDALAPHSAHSRYDMGLVALVSGDMERASAQRDSILQERPTHLLGLILAARIADAKGDSAGARAVRQRFLAVEADERSANLQEYRDHVSDLQAALSEAKTR